MRTTRAELCALVGDQSASREWTDARRAFPRSRLMRALIEGHWTTGAMVLGALVIVLSPGLRLRFARTVPWQIIAARLLRDIAS